MFRNAPPARKEEDDLPTTLSAGAVSFGSDSRPTSVAFSADGAHVITGSHDGFVEVWDAGTGALDTRLAYQSSDELMMLVAGSQTTTVRGRKSATSPHYL